MNLKTNSDDLRAKKLRFDQLLLNRWQSSLLSVPLSALIISALLVIGGCSKEAKFGKHLKQADGYYEKGELEKAEIEYLNARKFSPTNSHIIVRLGTIYQQQGDPRKGLAFLEAALRLDSNSQVALVKSAECRLELGDRETAYNRLSVVLDRTPTNAEAMRLLVASTVTDLQQSETRKRLETYKNVNGDPAIYHLAQAGLLAQKRDLTGAENEIKASLAANPKLWLAHEFLGGLYRASSNLVAADKALQAAVECAPPRTPAPLQYAQFKLASGNKEEAGKILKAVTDKTPDYAPAWMMTAELNLSERKTNEVLSALDRVIFGNASHYGALMFRSRMHYMFRNPIKALKDIESAARYYPGDENVTIELARMLMANTNASQALQVLQSVTNHLDGLIMKAELLMTQSGDIEGAERNLNLVSQRINGLIQMEAQRLKLDPRQMLQETNPPPRVVEIKTRWRQINALQMNLYQTKGQWAEFERLGRTLVQDEPRNPTHYLQLSLAYLNRTNFAEARNLTERAYELSGADPRLIERLVGLDLQLDDQERAVKRVQTILAKEPQSAYLNFMLGNIYFTRTNTWDKAEECFQNTIKLDDKISAPYVQLARIYRARGEADKALERLDELLDKNPKNIEARMRRVSLYQEKKLFDKVRADYEKLIEFYPAYWPALNDLAFVYAERFNLLDKAYDLAQKAYAETTKLTASGSNKGFAENARYLTGDTLAWIHYRRGNYPQALALLREVAARLPHNGEIQYHLGMVYLMMERPQEARSCLQIAANVKTDYLGKDEAKSRLAALVASGGAMPLGSIADLEKEVKKNPNNTVALAQLGERYFQESQPQKAGDAFKQVLKLNPNAFAANLRLAELYSGPLADRDKAIEHARKAREISPQDYRASHLLGQLAYQMGNYSWAANLLQETYRAQPANPQVAYDFGWAAYTQGRLGDARQAMEKAQASSTLANAAKGFLLFLDGYEKPESLAGAETQAKEILKTDSTYVPALLVEGLAQNQRGQADEAIKTFEAVLKKYPQFIPAMRFLALLYSVNPDRDKTTYDFAMKAREAYGNDPALAKVLGRINVDRKDYRSAVRFLVECQRAYPNDPEVFFYLGKSYNELKESTPAREALDKAVALGLKEPMANEAKAILNTL